MSEVEPALGCRERLIRRREHGIANAAHLAVAPRLLQHRRRNVEADHAFELSGKRNHAPADAAAEIKRKPAPRVAAEAALHVGFNAADVLFAAGKELALG